MPEFRVLFPDKFGNPDDFDRFGDFDPVRNAQTEACASGDADRLGGKRKKS